MADKATEEDATTEILRTLHSIVSGFKTELQQVRSAQLRPEDVSIIVEAHNTKSTEEVKQLQSAVAHLKVKSQQRISMDPEFMAEVKRMISDAPREKRAAIAENAASDHLSAAQRAEVQAELQAYISQLEPQKAKHKLAPPQPVREMRYVVKLPPVPRSTRFAQHQKMLSEQRERKRQELLVQRKSEMDAVASRADEIEQQHQAILDHEEAVRVAQEHLKAVQTNVPRPKNQRNMAKYTADVEQARHDLLQVQGLI